MKNLTTKNTNPVLSLLFGLVPLQNLLLKSALVWLVFFGGLPLLNAQDHQKDNQWWIGLKTGTNTSNPTLIERFEVLSFGSGNQPIKDYTLKQGWGYHLGFVGAWDILPDLNISLQPYFSAQPIAYSKRYQWQSESHALTIKDHHHITLNNIYIPLMVRYQLPIPPLRNTKGTQSKKKSDPIWKSGSIKKNRSRIIPYLQTGFFYGRLLAARNQVTRAQTTDGFEEGTSQELMDITALFNHRTVGFSLGAGASYDISGSFRVSLDVTYNQGLSNLTNQANRYTNETMTLKYMDSLDDMRLQHWNIAWHFIFPLKFVYSGNYKSI